MGQPKVTPLVEAFHDGGFIVSVANGHRSFDQMTLTGATKVLAGTLLGIALAAASATSTTVGTNTGNGTMGGVTLVAPATQVGVYVLTYTDATHYTVTAPDGQTATGVNGTPFSALGIGLTMTTGGAAMVAGDGFDVTTTQAVGKPNIAAVAHAGNTGNSTAGSLSTAGYAPQVGVYAVEFDDATHFVVSDPQGVEVGHGTTGVAFSGGGLGFTITAGGTAFLPGDSFAITVGAGSGSWKPWDPANADGSQVVAGILYATRDVTSGDLPAVALARDGEVNQAELIFPTGANAAVIAAGVAGLKALGILAR
jgi:hypothetical protein